LDQGLVRKGTRRLEAAWKSQRDLDTALLLAAVMRDTRGGAKRIDPILAEASKLTERHPRGREVVALRVESLLAAGHEQQALPIIENAVKRFPGSARLLVARARVLARTGRQADAHGVLAAAEQAIASPAEGVMVATAQGDLQAKGNEQVALSAYEKALSYDGRRQAPRVARALVLLSQDDTDAARAELFKLSAVNPRAQLDRPFDPSWRPDWSRYASRSRSLKGKTNEVALLRGVVAFHAGDSRAANRALGTVLRADKSNPVALLYLATNEMQAGDATKAYTKLLRLDALDPSNLETQRQLALAEAAAQKADSARARADRLPADDRTTAERETLLAVIEHSQGNVEKARYHFQRALLADAYYAPPRRGLAGLPQVLTP
jgi:predicted Zn-dependent protease